MGETCSTYAKCTIFEKLLPQKRYNLKLESSCVRYHLEPLELNSPTLITYNVSHYTTVMPLNSRLLIHFSFILVAAFASKPSRPTFIEDTTTPSLLSFVPSSPVNVRGYGPVFGAMSSPSPSDGALPSPPTVAIPSNAAAPFVAGCHRRGEEGPERPCRRKEGLEHPCGPQGMGLEATANG